MHIMYIQCTGKKNNNSAHTSIYEQQAQYYVYLYSRLYHYSAKIKKTTTKESLARAIAENRKNEIRAVVQSFII